MILYANEVNVQVANISLISESNILIKISKLPLCKIK